MVVVEDGVSLIDLGNNGLKIYLGCGVRLFILEAVDGLPVSANAKVLRRL